MRVDFLSYQGEAPQACWRQVKGIQRRHSEKDAAELSIFGLRIVLILELDQPAGLAAAGLNVDPVVEFFRRDLDKTLCVPGI